MPKQVKKFWRSGWYSATQRFRGFLHKMFQEQGDIIQSVAQRRNFNMVGSEAIEKVAAERTGLHAFF